MKQISVVKSVLKFAPLALAVSCSLTLLSGCGSSNSAAPANATISGTIVAAPVSGADVSVVDGNGNVVVEAVKTDVAGQYTLVIPFGSLTQDLIIKSTGGAFTDEASGEAGIATEMYAYMSADSISNPSSVSVTPGSTIIADLVMDHNKTKAQAEEVFAKAFGYTPDMSVMPSDAAAAPAEGASEESTLAGFRAAAFSQLAMDLGLSQNEQFEMFAALAQDLSDDKLDGVDASGAVAIGATGSSLEADIQSRFATALINFKANKNNLTGLNNAQIGNLPFGKIVFTDSYQIEYKQMGMMDPMEGKSVFQIHVTDRNDGSDVTGMAPMLMTMMNMAAHSHSTPMSTPAVVEDADGLYTVTLYYLMPSQMMDGTSMGYWDLKFTVAGEVAHFYPAVMMAMGDTAMVRLKGVDDKVTNMDGLTVGRTYPIFKESLMSTTGTHKFSVFVAVQESMMSFPAVFDGSLLNGNAIDATVEISDDDGASWKNATDDGAGIWSVSGLKLTETQDEADEIRIRLTINDTVYDEMKTTDGKAVVPGDNDFNTFTVTPVTAAMM